MPSFELESVFQQIAVLLLVSAAIGGIALRLKQPLIVAFIFVGIAAGPRGIGLLGGQEAIELLADIGIALLLFVVGLKLDLHLIKTVGPVALAAGLGQVFFTSSLGFVIALALGLTPVVALYVAIALTFSSTIIIVKLLSDKRELEETHGRIALGILIVQDIVVVLVMIAITAFGDRATDTTFLEQLGLVALRGALFLGVIAALMQWVLPPLLHRLADEREMLILFAVAWAVSLAALGEALGFSEEVGAFLAGLSLASTGYRDAIGGRLVTLRDFLLLFFFLNLGSELDFAAAGDHLFAAVVLSLFVLVGNPIIVMAIMGSMGYKKRTSFLTGLTVAQISEFSLIFAALGLSLGHIGDDAMGLITAVGIVTIGLSTYLILYSKQIFDRVGPRLGIFERRKVRASELDKASEISEKDVVVFGLGRYGGNIFRTLDDQGVSVLGVDFDPEKVRRYTAEGRQVIFGDSGDPEVGEQIGLERTKIVVDTTPDQSASLTLLHTLKMSPFQGWVAVTARIEEQVELLEEAGADEVLLPFRDAAKDAVGTVGSILKPSASND